MQVGITGKPLQQLRELQVLMGRDAQFVISLALLILKKVELEKRTGAKAILINLR